MRKIFITITFFLSNFIFSQNPITDSDYFKAYPKLKIFEYAKNAYDLDYKICSYLVSQAKLEKKMAVIDAFNTEAEMEAGNLFFEFLKSKFQYNSIDEISNPEHKLLLAYLYMTSDIYVSKKLLKEVKNLYNNRLTYNVISFFINSFENINKNRCKIWKDFQKLDNTNFKINDFNEKSMYLIAKKVNDYKDNCSKIELATTKTKRYFKYNTSHNIFKLKNDNGIYSINVTINNALNIDFIFDSGASLVQIPEDVFRVLLRMKKINKNNIVGKQNFTLADGSSIQRPIIIIKSLKIGNIEVKDVKAVIGNLDSELLLGQSFQKKFKNIKIDNKNNRLIIEK